MVDLKVIKLGNTLFVCSEQMEIKLRGEAALEQRFRLESEGVRFRGKRVDMKQHEFRFPRSAKRVS